VRSHTGVGHSNSILTGQYHPVWLARYRRVLAVCDNNLGPAPSIQGFAAGSRWAAMSMMTVFRGCVDACNGKQQRGGNDSDQSLAHLLIPWLDRYP
jgi:hypothetical protein